MQFSRKFPDVGDNTETCRSSVTERIHSCRVVYLLVLPELLCAILEGMNNINVEKSAYFVHFFINSMALYSRVAQIPGAMLPSRLNCTLLAPYLVGPQ